MKQFTWGVLSALCAVAATFFLRYWRESGDRLFAYFSFAFFSMCLNWLALACIDPGAEQRHYVYLIRLVAFAFILIGIADRNFRDRG